MQDSNATARSGQVGKLLVGCYDIEKRNQEIIERLCNGILRIQRMNLHKQKEQTTSETETIVQQDDSATTFNQRLQELAKLKLDVSNFSGRQCTTEYRRLQERCVKLQMALDNLLVDEMADLRCRRRTVLAEINVLSKNIFGQTHPDGVACQECIR